MRKVLLSLMVLGLLPVELRSQGAAAFHVFPQIADGVLGDGTGYSSLVLATNVSSQPATCTLRPYGRGLANRFSGSSFSLPASGSFNIMTTMAARDVFLPLTTGYATLSCDQPVVAEVAYTYFSAAGILSGATIFSSPATTRAQLVTLAGSRLAIGVANDTDSPGQYQLSVSNSSGQTVGSGTLSVAARSSGARFLDELVTVPANLTGVVSITSSSGAFSVVGLVFFGLVFLSQPAVTLDTPTSALGANQSPAVKAGPSQTITLPSSASLSGTATDDGLPGGVLTTSWSKVSGPGTVIFGNASAVNTTASFSAAGSYVLRLTASDGMLSSTGDVAINVNPASAGGIIISTPLALDKTTVLQGQTLNATVTYKNTSTSAITINLAVIASRPPGGTHAGGPYNDLSPVLGVTTIQPGATLQVSASRAFTNSDPTGTWEAYPTYQDASLVWHDGPSIYFTVESAPAPPAQLWSIGYYTPWGHGSPALPISQIDWGGLTHIFHAAAIIHSDGTFDLTSELIPTDAPKLISAAHAHGVKVSLVIWQSKGPGGHYAFRNAVNNNRAGVVNSVINLVDTYGYDGVDLDIEPLAELGPFPGFALFAADLRARLGTRLLTAAAITIDYAFWATAHTNFDRISLMTYDYTNTSWNPYSWHNSALYDPGDGMVWGVNTAVTKFTSVGVPRAKIHIGIPFYGYVCTGSVTAPRQPWGSTSCTQLYYGGLLANYNLSNPSWDAYARVPYIGIHNAGSSNDRFITFDNEQSVLEKIQYVKSQGLGGWIIWELVGDYIPSQTPNQPLLNVIKNNRWN